jgi:hypothetical protein
VEDQPEVGGEVAAAYEEEEEGTIQDVIDDFAQLAMSEDRDDTGQEEQAATKEGLEQQVLDDAEQLLEVLVNHGGRPAQSRTGRSITTLRSLLSSSGRAKRTGQRLMLKSKWRKRRKVGRRKLKRWSKDRSISSQISTSSQVSSLFSRQIYSMASQFCLILSL